MGTAGPVGRAQLPAGPLRAQARPRADMGAGGRLQASSHSLSFLAPDRLVKLPDENKGKRIH